MKSRLLLTTVAAVGMLGAGAAYAADLPAPQMQQPVAKYAPVSSWGGLYVGAVGAYGWGDSSATLVSPISGAGVGTSPEGGLVGGTIGYNWQAGKWVLGVEGDISAGNLGGTSSTTSFPPTTAAYDMNWLGTVRGRLGVATTAFGNPTLWYVTGGVAWAGMDRTVQNTFNTPAVSTSGTHTGWTLGAGVEYAINNNWSVKGEYLYADLGSANYVGGFPYSPPETTSVDLTVNLVRVGINYKF